MKRFFQLAVAVILAALGPMRSPAATTPTIPVSQIHAGMKGVAYTVFQGTMPEPMSLTVLGILKNMNGPGADVILVRLEGPKPEFTGVVAGMSGSPVYIDGRLAGALAFRIGEFSKEPIAGVTPIHEMLEIAADDRSSTAASAVAAIATTSDPTTNIDISGMGSELRPIGTPLVFSGFTQDAIKLLSPQLAAAGIVPVMGIGAISDEKQPDPVIPGSAISAVLVRGDLDLAATCTVTYIDDDHLLACGHPLLQLGNVSMPMNKAQVVATLPSPANAFKIVNTTEPIGSFTQDRHAGILGHFNANPDMVPVELEVKRPLGTKTFRYEVLNHPKLTPVAIMSTTLSILEGINEYGEDISYRFQGAIQIKGFHQLQLEGLYAPANDGSPTALQAALSLGDRFLRLYNNQVVRPNITKVKLEFELLNEHRSALLDSVHANVLEARPGQDIVLEASLRPYRGEPITRTIKLRIPDSTPKGQLHILVSDGDSLNSMHRTTNAFINKLDLESLIELLNHERPNDRLYVSLLEPTPEAVVKDEEMPVLPLSVANVMDGMRGSQDMLLLGQSAVYATSIATDYVVSGAQWLTLTIQ